MRRERAALVELGRAIIDGAPEGLEGLVLGSPQRLEVYRYGFGARTRRALEHVFPRTREALGQARWLRAGAAYAQGPAALVHNLNDVGRDFPDFLPRPAVAELARLEWLMVEATRAPRLPVLGLERLSSASVALQPHLRLLVLRHNTLVRLHTPRARGRRLVRPVPVRVSQATDGALVRPLSRPEHALARLMLTGRSFPAAVEGARAGAHELARILASWAADGLLCERAPSDRAGRR